MSSNRFNTEKVAPLAAPSIPSRVNRRLNVSPRGGEKQFLDRNERFSLGRIATAIILPRESGWAVRFPCPNCHKKSLSPRLSLSALLFPISSVLSALQRKTAVLALLSVGERECLPADRDNVRDAVTVQLVGGGG